MKEVLHRGEILVLSQALSPGGALPWFLYAFVPFLDLKPHSSIIDPFVRQIQEKVGKNDLKKYDSEDFWKFLPLKSSKHAFLRGETSILSRKGPCCKAKFQK